MVNLCTCFPKFIFYGEKKILKIFLHCILRCEFSIVTTQKLTGKKHFGLRENCPKLKYASFSIDEQGGKKMLYLHQNGITTEFCLVVL